jgi:hypothetical protein
MTRHVVVAILCAWLFASPSTAAFPAEPAAATTETADIHSSSHDGFGRIVFDTPPHTTYHVSRDGTRLTINFVDSITLSTPPAAPRNVVSIEAKGAQADLIIARGATFHVMQQGPHVTIEVFDAVQDGSAAAIRAVTQAPAKPAAPQGATPSTPLAAKTPEGTKPRAPDAAKLRAVEAARSPMSDPVPPAAGQAARPPAAAQDQPAAGTASLTGKPNAGRPGKPGATTTATIQATIQAAPVAPQTEHHVPVPPPTVLASQPAAGALPTAADPSSAAGPIMLLAHRTTPPTGTPGAAFAVPFPISVGAAVFSHGTSTFVVFDERRPIDLAALRVDPVFGSTSVQ